MVRDHVQHYQRQEVRTTESERSLELTPILAFLSRNRNQLLFFLNGTRTLCWSQNLSLSRVRLEPPIFEHSQTEEECIGSIFSVYLQCRLQIHCTFTMTYITYTATCWQCRCRHSVHCSLQCVSSVWAAYTAGTLRMLQCSCSVHCGTAGTFHLSLGITTL